MERGTSYSKNYSIFIIIKLGRSPTAQYAGESLLRMQKNNKVDEFRALMSETWKISCSLLEIPLFKKAHE